MFLNVLFVLVPSNNCRWLQRKSNEFNCLQWFLIMSIDFTWPKTCSQTCPINSKSVRVVKRILMTSFDVPIKCDPVKWVEFNWCQHIVPSDCKWFDMFFNVTKWLQVISNEFEYSTVSKTNQMKSPNFECFQMFCNDFMSFQVISSEFTFCQLSSIEPPSNPPVQLYLALPITWDKERNKNTSTCIGGWGIESAFRQATRNWEIISCLACVLAVE